MQTSAPCYVWKKENRKSAANIMNSLVSLENPNRTSRSRLSIVPFSGLMGHLQGSRMESLQGAEPHRGADNHQ